MRGITKGKTNNEKYSGAEMCDWDIEGALQLLGILCRLAQCSLLTSPSVITVMRKRFSGQVLNLANSVLIFKVNTPKDYHSECWRDSCALQCFTAASFIVDVSKILLYNTTLPCRNGSSILLIVFLSNHHSPGGTFDSCKSLFLHSAWVGAHQSWAMMWAQCARVPFSQGQTCAHPCATLVLTLQAFPMEGGNTGTKVVMIETFLNPKYTFLFVK